MSQQNVEIVRRTLDGWNRGDLSAWLGDAAPDIEWTPAAPAVVERAVHSGHEAMTAGWQSLREAWREFHFDESEVRDLGESVLWLGHAHAKGNASDLESHQEWAIVCRLADAKIKTIRSYLTWREALGAVGLAQ